jgi:hypothetical protein
MAKPDSADKMARILDKTDNVAKPDSADKMARIGQPANLVEPDFVFAQFPENLITQIVKQPIPESIYRLALHAVKKVDTPIDQFACPKEINTELSIDLSSTYQKTLIRNNRCLSDTVLNRSLVKTYLHIGPGSAVEKPEKNYDSLFNTRCFQSALPVRTLINIVRSRFQSGGNDYHLPSMSKLVSPAVARLDHSINILNISVPMMFQNGAKKRQE